MKEMSKNTSPGTYKVSIDTEVLIEEFSFIEEGLTGEAEYIIPILDCSSHQQLKKQLEQLIKQKSSIDLQGLKVEKYKENTCLKNKERKILEKIDDLYGTSFEEFYSCRFYNYKFI